MKEKTPWPRLLGLPEDVKEPDLYQVLGLDRRSFEASHVERAFMERMLAVQKNRASESASLVERAKDELQRSRRILLSSTERAAYDRELVARLAAKLRRAVETASSRGPIDRELERALLSAGHKRGLTDDEARRILDVELARVRSDGHKTEAAPIARRRHEEAEDLEVSDLEVSNVEVRKRQREGGRSDESQVRKKGETRGDESSIRKKSDSRFGKRSDMAQPPVAETMLSPPSSPPPKPQLSLPSRALGSSAPKPLHDGLTVANANETPVPSRSGTGAAEISLEETRHDKVLRGDLVGQTIDDKYEVVSKLGEGGMGAVFKARHRLLDKFVALKVVNPALSDRVDVRERFLREAKAAMEFVHPNAVPLRDFGITRDGLLFMTQDFSPGQTLRAIVADTDGPIETPRALAIARQCLLALGEAHHKGIVHRDIKPENILVERDDHSGDEVSKVCDFGIAKITDGETTIGGLTGGTVIGTPHYMPPEQGAGDRVDARADLYSVGCVLYELLTGSKVFDAHTAVQVIMMHVTQVAEPPSKRLPDLGARFDALIAKALAKVPAQRFQSAEEFIEAIDALGVELPGRVAPTARSGQPKTRSIEKKATEPPSPEKRASQPQEKRTPQPTQQQAKPAQQKAKTTRTQRTPPTVVPKKTVTTDMLFCDRCGVSVPARWKKTHEAKKVGSRLLCAKCFTPVHDGKLCMGCLKVIEPGSGAIEAGGKKRICKACAAKSEVLRVCHGCEVILPKIAFDRGLVHAYNGKNLCRECFKKLKR